MQGAYSLSMPLLLIISNFLPFYFKPLFWFAHFLVYTIYPYSVLSIINIYFISIEIYYAEPLPLFITGVSNAFLGG